MKCLLHSIVLFLASGSAFAMPYAQLPTAAQLKNDIAKLGAHEVLVNRLFASDRVSDGFFNQVATGKPEWLEIAVALRPASDAGSSESLVGSVSLALVNQPRRVLHLLADSGSGFTVSDICSGRLVYLEQPEKEAKWRSDARRKVGGINDKSLADVRASCLAQLQK